MVQCVKQYQKKGYVFKEGESYKGCQVNDNWWVIDAVGITLDEFKNYFEEKTYGLERTLSEAIE